MDKHIKKVKLSVSFIKERGRYIAYTPALDLSTSGKSIKEAKKRFEEIVEIFLDELVEKGTLNEVLENLGWQKTHKQWNPPKIVSNSSELIKIPAGVC